jgi:hypothetical protein
MGAAGTRGGRAAGAPWRDGAALLQRPRCWLALATIAALVRAGAVTASYLCRGAARAGGRVRMAARGAPRRVPATCWCARACGRAATCSAGPLCPGTLAPSRPPLQLAGASADGTPAPLANPFNATRIVIVPGAARGAPHGRAGPAAAAGGPVAAAPPRTRSPSYPFYPPPTPRLPSTGVTMCRPTRWWYGWLVTQMHQKPPLNMDVIVKCDPAPRGRRRRPHSRCCCIGCACPLCPCQNIAQRPRTPPPAPRCPGKCPTAWAPTRASGSPS